MNDNRAKNFDSRNFRNALKWERYRKYCAGAIDFPTNREQNRGLFWNKTSIKSQSSHFCHRNEPLLLDCLEVRANRSSDEIERWIA